MSLEFKKTAKTILARLEHAKYKHPEGTTLKDLESEVMEVFGAVEDSDEYIYELFDVITVCLRLIEFRKQMM